MSIMDLEDMQTTVHDWWSKHAPELYDLEVTVFYGDPDDAPMRGQSCYISNDWDGQDRYGETVTATYLVVPHASYGDYNGSSTYERSNFEALQKDYPDTFVIREYDNAKDLLLPFTTYISDALGDTLARLTQTVLYDEDHHWELESRLLREWWDTSGFDGEYKYTVHQILGENEYETPLDDLKITDEWLEAEWWRLIREYDDATECDGPDSVYFRSSVVEKIAVQVADQIIADWNARVTWLTDRQEGLFA